MIVTVESDSCSSCIEERIVYFGESGGVAYVDELRLKG